MTLRASVDTRLYMLAMGAGEDGQPGAQGGGGGGGGRLVSLLHANFTCCQSAVS